MRRKFLFLFLIFAASALSLNCQTKTAEEKVKPCKYLSFADAEKILGAQVELVTNSWTFTKDITRFDCTYRAVEKDKASGKDINLYFSSEQQDSTAEQVHEVFETASRKINEPDIFVGKLSGIGDEAFLISNPPHFHFMMARKGKNIFRIKLNKAGEGTSLEELKAVVKKIVEQL
jgi:hypothetical protein